MKHSYSISYKNVALKPISENELEYLRTWRNDPANTRYLRQIPYITPEMQKKWFDSYLANEDEMTFAICETKQLGRVVGSLSLYEFCDGEAEFGKILIGDGEAHGKSIGLNATVALLKIAFTSLKLNKVRLHVFKDNVPAVKVYAKAGFVTVDEHETNGMKELTMEITAADFLLRRPNKDDAYMISFPQCGDARGRMNVVEGGSKIPFEIKRVFYSYATDKDAIRGQHANRNSEFVMIALAGSCKVRVLDTAGDAVTFELNSAEQGLYVPKMLWKDMLDFSEDCVLLVLSSEHYDSGEYIRDLDAYLKMN